MNILITSAGRRMSLLQAFKEAAAGEESTKVYAGDLSSLAPCLYMADGYFRLPRILDDTYTDEIKRLIEEHDISLVVPTIDTELPVLAENRETLESGRCTILVSSQNIIEMAQDKWKTFSFFSCKGIRTPRSWLPGMDVPDEKLFIKPRNGSASIDTFSISRGEIPVMANRIKDPIIQEYLKGEEITIDALLDLEGRPIHFVPRKRIKTIGGESIQGITLDNPELDEWVLHILDIVSEEGAVGPLTLQAFITEDGFVLSEINPRFGGGFPLAYAAGALYPQWLIAMISGQKVSPRLGQYKKGLYMTRYYKEIFTQNPPWRA